MIAYEGNNSLCFDTEVFKSAEKVYAEKAKQMASIKTDLTGAIEQLKDAGWKSAAGKAFYANLNVNWAGDIQRYSDLLAMLSECISDAAADYDELRNEAAALKINTEYF